MKTGSEAVPSSSARADRPSLLAWSNSIIQPTQWLKRTSWLKIAEFGAYAGIYCAAGDYLRGTVVAMFTGLFIWRRNASFAQRRKVNAYIKYTFAASIALTAYKGVEDIAHAVNEADYWKVAFTVATRAGDVLFSPFYCDVVLRRIPALMLGENRALPPASAIILPMASFDGASGFLFPTANARTQRHAPLPDEPTEGMPRMLARGTFSP